MKFFFKLRSNIVEFGKKMKNLIFGFLNKIKSNVIDWTLWVRNNRLLAYQRFNNLIDFLIRVRSNFVEWLVFTLESLESRISNIFQLISRRISKFFSEYFIKYLEKIHPLSSYQRKMVIYGLIFWTVFPFWFFACLNRRVIGYYVSKIVPSILSSILSSIYFFFKVVFSILYAYIYVLYFFAYNIIHILIIIISGFFK